MTEPAKWCQTSVPIKPYCFQFYYMHLLYSAKTTTYCIPRLVLLVFWICGLVCKWIVRKCGFVRLSLLMQLLKHTHTQTDVLAFILYTNMCTCTASVYKGRQTEQDWQSVTYLGTERWILFFDGCCLRWNVSEASSYLISLVRAGLFQSAWKSNNKKYIKTQGHIT